ncbi:alpha/beta hydrolase [Hydrogenophaga flava]|uniref:alpha/beta hydrolase n=1 Tax=Hydrogenophaga flava TaxID=65657 RepID=UPI000824F986|nr:alpha/beta hydrolase [Hydrogenophaga flava]
MPGGARPEHITAAFDGYSLAGRFRWSSNQHCRLLAIHGARSDHRRLDALLHPLQAAGVGSLAGDLSGRTGQSPLANADTSLANNLREALRFSALLGPALDTVFGHSLGGALAMKLAEQCQRTVRTLVLSGPALYPEAAYAVARYGPEFTRAISTPFGFMDSSSLPFLRSFAGHVVLVVGQYDGLPAEHHGGVRGRSAGLVDVRDVSGTSRTVYSPIPAEVFEAIRDAASGHLSEIVLEACDHKVLSHLARHPAAARALAQKLQHLMAHGPQTLRCHIATDGSVCHR